MTPIAGTHIVGCVTPLLFAWLPIVGDPLTLVAGVLRVRFWTFVTLVALGKAPRYAAVLASAMWWSGA